METAKTILEQLDRLGKEPITRNDIEKRKARLLAAQSLLTETSATYAAHVASLFVQDRPAAEAVDYYRGVSETTNDAVVGVARRYLSADAATLIVAGDASKFIGELRRLRGKIELIKPNLLELGPASLERR